MQLAGSAIAALLQGRAIGAGPEQVHCTIDTRTLKPGDTYVALRGDRFDGHAFLREAQAQGAAAAIVDDEGALPSGLPGWLVEDTRRAYLVLAAAARRQFCGAVLAITGSAGKTSTKEFLAHILRQTTGGPIAASPANENNEIGVAKLLHGLGTESTVVVEMGARRVGDIALLVEMAQPHFSLLTNIGDAHIEIFGSREQLIATKWEIFSPQAQPIINLGDEVSCALQPRLAKPPILFGLQEDLQRSLPGLYECAVILEDGQLTFQRPARASVSVPFDTDVPGEHNRRNLVAACAGALALGMPLTGVARAAQGVRLPAGRYERRPMALGAIVIHDAYNASPSGSLASLAAFAAEPAERRFVVFGSMAELGSRAVDEHQRVGAAIAALAPSHAFLGGEYAAELMQGAQAAGLSPAAMSQFASNDDLLRKLRPLLQSGDSVLVKGSRMYHLEEVIDALTIQPDGEG